MRRSSCGAIISWISWANCRQSSQTGSRSSFTQTDLQLKWGCHQHLWHKRDVSTHVVFDSYNCFLNSLSSHSLVLFFPFISVSFAGVIKNCCLFLIAKYHLPDREVFILSGKFLFCLTLFFLLEKQPWRLLIHFILINVILQYKYTDKIFFNWPYFLHFYFASDDVLIFQIRYQDNRLLVF